RKSDFSRTGSWLRITKSGNRQNLREKFGGEGGIRTPVTQRVNVISSLPKTLPHRLTPTLTRRKSALTHPHKLYVNVYASPWHIHKTCTILKALIIEKSKIGLESRSESDFKSRSRFQPMESIKEIFGLCMSCVCGICNL